MRRIRRKRIETIEIGEVARPRREPDALSQRHAIMCNVPQNLLYREQVVATARMANDEIGLSMRYASRQRVDPDRARAGIIDGIDPVFGICEARLPSIIDVVTA